MSAEIKIFPEQQRGMAANVNDRRRPVQPVAPAPEVMDIKHVMNVLSRQRHIIIGTALLVFLVTVLAIFQIKPMYQSSAQIMIEPRQARVVDVEQVVQGLPADQETIRSEQEIIRSRKLVEAVINKLNLWQSWELNESLRPAGPARAMKNFFAGLNQRADADAAAKADLVKQAVIDKFLDNLSVSAVRNSRVITISFQSENPQTARAITTAMVDTYLTQQLEDKFEATQRASVWLNQRLTELRKKVSDSEQAVETYRASAGLTQGRDSTLSAQQLSEINTQLIMARTQRAEVESKLRQVQGLSANNLDTASDVLQSPTIQKLREQESTLIQKQAELSGRLGPRHPDMLKIQAELGDVKKNIQVEIGRIINGLRNDVAVARSREGALAGSLQGVTSQQGALGAANVKLRALEREADANRALFETFLNRFKQTSSQEDLQAADARLISAAALPAEPIFPKPKIMLPAGAVAGIVLGMMMALLMETLDRGFRSMEQVEQYTGLSPLGLVPELAQGPGKRLFPADYVVQHPTSAYAEAIRTVRTAVLLSQKAGAGARAILVTSSMPAEGKTSFVLSFARVSAMSGQKILIIDCDTRRPNIHKGMGMPNKLGIVDVLLGTHKLAEVLQMDKRSSVQVISAGRSVPNPADLLASDKMKSLLVHLRSQYDLIILDSPPTLAVSDARVLSELVDKTVFISRWAETARDVVQMATRQLASHGANLAGVLLTRVNVQKNSRYGYADSGYYGRKYTKYYGTAK